MQTKSQNEKSRASIAHALSPASAPILYFVLCHFDSGSAFVEREPYRMTREATIRDIVSGDLEDIHRIYEACTEGPIFNDVTEDVLAEADALQEQDFPSIAELAQDARDQHYDNKRKEMV